MAPDNARHTITRSPLPGKLRNCTYRSTLGLSAALAAALFAFGDAPGIAQTVSRQNAQPFTRADFTGQPAWYDSVDAYKQDAAQHIVRRNIANTFHGPLPPMLPAVVVLLITVDATGRATEVSVQRSPDDEASAVAMASIYHSGRLPRPYNLAVGPRRSLTYSETFLFNADYRFQIRTLAPVQGAE